MEYALRAQGITPGSMNLSRLNPCFNGVCPKGRLIKTFACLLAVLILVLMEYALRGD
jgi:hypothetical protein